MEKIRLIDFMGDDYNIFILITSIFSTIQTINAHLFEGFDSESLREIGAQFYFDNRKKPLKALYVYYCNDSTFVDWTDDESIAALFAHIGKIAYDRFGDNWARIAHAYCLDYEPLENYNMEQVRTPDLTYTGANSRNTNTKVETSGKTKIVPFNSTTETETGASEGESTTTELEDGNNSASTNTETGTETLTRHGNTGVTTSQQLLQSEIDLRKFDLIRRICKDIESILFRSYWR